MTLNFDIFDDASGVFEYTGEHDRAHLARYDRLVEDHADGRLGDKELLTEIARLLADAPELLDAHLLMARHFHGEGKPKKALEAARRGLAVAHQHVPDGFSGHIEWGHLENRAYLRLLQFAALSYIRLRRHRDAVTTLDLMLARNPDDNQGARFMLGSEALRAGQFERAREVLTAFAGEFPPYFYELALCCMLKGDWVAAATALRRGFAANPYIAEHLCGNPYPLALAIWHESDMADPETALTYVGGFGAYWRQQRDSIGFVRWLFNHSKVLAERAAIMECRESLMWEHDASARSAIVEREMQLIARIDDAISVAIVVQRKDQEGRLVWPWTQAGVPAPDWMM